MACSKALLVILLVAVANAKALSIGNFSSNEYQPDYDASAEDGKTSSYQYSSRDLDEDDDNSGEDEQNWASLYTDAQAQEDSEPSKPTRGGSTTWSNGMGLSVTIDGSVISIDGPEVHDTFDGMPDGQIARDNNRLLVTSSDKDQWLYSETRDTIVQMKGGVCNFIMYRGGERAFSYDMNSDDCANLQEIIKPMTSTGGVYNL